MTTADWTNEHRDCCQHCLHQHWRPLDDNSVWRPTKIISSHISRSQQQRHSYSVFMWFYEPLTLMPRGPKAVISKTISLSLGTINQSINQSINWLT